MRDILYPDEPEQPKDAYVSVRKSMARPLPKRFYAEATVGEGPEGFRILLDGKMARTPGRKVLALPTRAAAEQVAAEWQGQVEHIDPAAMHATRMANVGIDRVDAVRDEVIDDIAKYAGSDLICYRAADPQGLVEQENRHWNPVLAHMRARHGASFMLAEGVGFAEQPAEARAAVRAAVASIADPVALAAFHTLTTIGGSVLIALALRDGALTAEQAFDAASVDEDWNAQLWGEDAEATQRRAGRRREFMAAADLLEALEKPAGA